MAKTAAETLSWAQLHGAVGASCAAWRDSREHHRKLLEELKQVPANEWPEYTLLFRASAENARRAREAKAA